MQKHVYRRITLRTLQQNARKRGDVVADAKEHSHWDWAAKLAAFGRDGRFYGIETDGMIQGLMLLRLDKQGRLPAQQSSPLVYVDYIEAAPWNLIALGNPPRFRGVGTALLKVAIRESYRRGWEGRFGLHSLPQAEGFYQRIGMTDLGADPNYENLHYFEMRGLQAVEWERG
jgi:GNAT superfamily N-acetyltransferase